VRRALAGLATLVGAALLMPASASAGSSRELVTALANPETEGDALEQLVAMKFDALPALCAAASDGHDLVQRGWAIVALRRIGGVTADATLARIVAGAEQPVVVRTWAAAGRIDLAPDLDRLLAFAPLLQTYPAVRRPFTLRLTELGAAGQPLDVAELLAVSAQDAELQAAVAPLILGLPPARLVEIMLHGSSQQLRMQAAGYLAARGRDPDATIAVATAVVQSLAFQPGATKPPWDGGPLYIPRIAWTQGPATQLVGELIRWHVWSSLHRQLEVARQVDQSLNGVGLGRVVGYAPVRGTTRSEQWLQVWAQVAGGRQAVEQLLAEQGAASDPRFAELLSSLNTQPP
jgi:hypothetical protein